MGLRLLGVALIAALGACGGGNLGGSGAAGTASPGAPGTAGTVGSGEAGTVGTGGVVGDAGSGPPPGGSGGSIAGSSGGAIAGSSGGAIAGSSGGGTTGTGGGGAGGTPLPACGGVSGTADAVGVAVASSDGSAVIGTVTAAVTVTSVDSCATVTCPASISVPGASFPTVAISPMATRIVLTAADARAWTLYLRYTALPADLIKAGDALDMTISGSSGVAIFQVLSQSITLARGANLVAFAYSGNGVGAPPSSDLQRFGVEVTDDGACGQPNGGQCPQLQHAARVKVGTESVRVARGTTAVGWLTFTLASFVGGNSSGGCDILSRTLMAGFRSPAGP